MNSFKKTLLAAASATVLVTGFAGSNIAFAGSMTGENSARYPSRLTEPSEPEFGSA